MRALRHIAAAAMLLLAAPAAPPAAAQTFDAAVAAYDRGDYATAYRGFRRLAEQGAASAQYNLGLMYKNGRGVRQDYAQAVKWYRRAAGQGDAFAQLSLGVMYSKGRGVPQDYTQAARWYRRAAAQDDARAQFDLGIMYDTGRGVPQDYAEAVKWYRRAAAQGYAAAQNNLGLIYGKGRGVPQDYAQAAKWFRRAAAQGHAHAQYNLGVMYEFGQGVRRDLVRAHKWYNLAASRSSAARKELRKRAVKSRNRVATRLTTAQLARAQRLARQWRPRARNAARPPADSGWRNRVAAESPPPHRALKKASTGSGFRVSAGGHVLTNAHVVRGCTEVRVPAAAGDPPRRVAVAARDKASDLALLRGPAGAPFARFRAGRGVRPGARVVVAGYPLRGVLAAGAIIGAGTVAALAGPGNDRRLIQITAPVQPGNSGGPVLDAAGNAAGVVVAKLNAIKIARATGDIPQNVNFAVSAGTARAFLDSEGVAYETAPSGTARAPEDVAAAAKRFTVLVECWK